MAGFTSGPWQDEIDVRDFIQRNYTPYAGDAAFLPVATDAHHRESGARSTAMFPDERERGIYDVDPTPRRPSRRTSPATSTRTTS